jgi:hypothetical protein
MGTDAAIGLSSRATRGSGCQLAVVLEDTVNLFSMVYPAVSVLVISVVGWLWPLKNFPNVGRPASETVISEQAVITGVTQTN